MRFAVLIKATVIREAAERAHEMAKRCAAQGKFHTNLVAHKGPTWTKSSSGDVFRSYTRLWGELVPGRCTLPIQAAKDSLLAKHTHCATRFRKKVARPSAGFPAGTARNLPSSRFSLSPSGHACA
ncbi:hypothetical protein H4582DRAFT_1310505 [Lactarius indigo]|nr:hypothetical protein H4582DRAFT_1310505 [Lactarius indigo]